jgi:hypothetical protein
VSHDCRQGRESEGRVFDSASSVRRPEWGTTRTHPRSRTSARLHSLHNILSSNGLDLPYRTSGVRMWSTGTARPRESPVKPAGTRLFRPVHFRLRSSHRSLRESPCSLARLPQIILLGSRVVPLLSIRPLSVLHFFSLSFLFALFLSLGVLLHNELKRSIPLSPFSSLSLDNTSLRRTLCRPFLNRPRLCPANP